MVRVVLQQLQLSVEGLALSFLSSFMGSGNSLYNSTSVSWQASKEGKSSAKENILGLHFKVLHKINAHNQENIYILMNFSLQAAITHLFEGVTCNCLECLFYIYGFFGTGLKVWDVVLTLTPSLSPFSGYLCVRRETRYQYNEL